MLKNSIFNKGENLENINGHNKRLLIRRKNNAIFMD